MPVPAFGFWSLVMASVTQTDCDEAPVMELAAKIFLVAEGRGHNTVTCHGRCGVKGVKG